MIKNAIPIFVGIFLFLVLGVLNFMLQDVMGSILPVLIIILLIANYSLQQNIERYQTLIRVVLDEHNKMCDAYKKLEKKHKKVKK